MDKRAIISLVVLFVGCVAVTVSLMAHAPVQNGTDTHATSTSVAALLDGTQSTTAHTKTMQDGLIMTTTTEGTGVAIAPGQTAVVHYEGRFPDNADGTKGKVFDSSIPRGQPFSFTLGAGQVIRGWDEGVAGMKVGEVRQLVVPAALGYGARGMPPVIPGNATLVFDVTLLAIK